MKLNEILLSIVTSLVLLVLNGCDSVINVSDSDVSNVAQSVAQHNHITATDRNQHFHFCGEPPVVVNAVSNLMRNQKHNVFKVGEIAIYSCDVGYEKVSGNEETQCVVTDGPNGVMSSRWQPIDLMCQPVKCSDPGHVDDATRRVTAHFLYNTNVVYECKDGFRMIGVPFMTCKADGHWNRPKPNCQKKRCPEVESVANGRIVYSDVERKTDSKLEYVCQPGFKLNALNAIRYCRQDDSWSDLQHMNETSLECLVVKCESPIRPHTGLRILPSRSKSGNSYKPGDVIIFSCDTSPKTKASSKCLTDGQWSRGPPHCPEKTNYCPTIGDFVHGFYNSSTNLSKSISIKVNTRIAFYCDDSYILEGSPSMTCLSNGVWNTSVPKCAFNEAVRQSQSSQLTILITSIAALVVIVFVISCVVVCRWRQQQVQRRRWQQYFGHYNHRQSKTNIMLNQNEMKCFRQTPPKPTVPVTDL
ncbi:unnamed protein product [Medioppia subpectinata]|uniref:Sushi domain-containing protein n=1 Tax=Medioppia subpectinata TaxID=1979941 RepID=A0A7R9KCW9_9ACAR|nr:unnamed protein product [Medioppia subpectinata]CAG2100310.1 unnamed protein product [Medioppia subpectinata]